MIYLPMIMLSAEGIKNICDAHHPDLAPALDDAFDHSPLNLKNLKNKEWEELELKKNVLTRLFEANKSIIAYTASDKAKETAPPPRQYCERVVDEFKATAKLSPMKAMYHLMEGNLTSGWTDDQSAPLRRELDLSVLQEGSSDGDSNDGD